MVSFKARRSDPEVVAPASPTPEEIKALSDVDSQVPLWYYATVVEFFRRSHHAVVAVAPVDDVAEAVKEALGKALVYYYPMAGRLRRRYPDHRHQLEVECAGQGVVFVEARADDVRLDELGDPLVPPYPCIDELVVPAAADADNDDVLSRPLLLVQVTRFACGGFAVGVTVCHNVADAFGVVQFLKCIADLARGGGDHHHPLLRSPLPVWDRHLLMARDPPDLTGLPLSFHDDASATPPMPMDGMVEGYFVFGPAELAALRAQAEPDATAFELITAALWTCRTKAIMEALALALADDNAINSHHQPPASFPLLITMNVRGGNNKGNNSKLIAPPLPPGFYGNAFVFAHAALPPSSSSSSSLQSAVELVREAKRGVTPGYVRSMVDLFSLGGAAPYAMGWTFVVSDITRVGEDRLDMGWAHRVAGGVPIVGDHHATKLVSYQMRCKNAHGDDAVVASMYLPEPAMHNFNRILEVLLTQH